jgi:adenylyl- and sulfurtransferase ThiI
MVLEFGRWLFFLYVSKARGIDADPVFANASTVIMVFSGGIPSVAATAEMMRAFA